MRNICDFVPLCITGLVLLAYWGYFVREMYLKRKLKRERERFKTVITKALKQPTEAVKLRRHAEIVNLDYERLRN